MFVYIFCIIWATFFAFLAEREFKNNPTESKVGQQRKKYIEIIPKRKKASVAEHTSMIQPISLNKEEKSYDNQKMSNRQRQAEVILNGNDEIAIVAPANFTPDQTEQFDKTTVTNTYRSRASQPYQLNESTQKEVDAEGILVQEEVDIEKVAVVIPDEISTDPNDTDKYKIEEPPMQTIHKTIVANNLPLNRGPASRTYKPAKTHTIDIEFMDEENIENQKTAIEPVDKPSKKKPRITVIDDILSSKKHKNKSKNVKTKGKDIAIEQKSKSNRAHHIVGDEIFRGKENTKNFSKNKREKTAKQDIKNNNDNKNE